MTLIKAVTGVNITTCVAMESADLGILRWDEDRGAYAAMFGDNFEWWKLQGEWQSPSIVMYSKEFDVLGVPDRYGGITKDGRRKQLWPYPHNNNEFSTILPCDFIKVGNYWYVAAMVTKGLGNELRTIFWQSRNLYDWQKTDPYVSLDHKDQNGNPFGHPGNVMLTFDVIDDYVYIFGTGGLARNKPIWLWRCPVDRFPYPGFWEPWGFDNRTGWQWGQPNELTPILQGRYGELSFRHIQGNCVLSFFDVDRYTCSAITVEKPNDYWSAANRVDYANGQQFPQLYGGYISPASRLNEPGGMEFWVSQWNTSDHDPYHCLAFADTLQAKGPLKPQAPLTTKPPKPPSKPEEPPVTEPVPTDLKALIELLLRELSASGSILITTPEGENITLREAIAQIFEKERDWFGLESRPRHPNKTDDQLGHILSARTEGLFNQALLVAIADKFGIDADAIHRQVKESLQ
jgi:hypothetical protein